MASFLRKLSSRSKSRSNSPVKQCTQNHVADRRTEAIGDGWISSSRPPSPSKHSLTLPPPSPSQNRKTELTAQWNPVKGRFESPKKTPQKSLSKPSGYLSPDGHLLCDGQIPVASTSSYGLHDAHNYSNRNVRVRFLHRFFTRKISFSLILFILILFIQFSALIFLFRSLLLFNHLREHIPPFQSIHKKLINLH